MVAPAPAGGASPAVATTTPATGRRCGFGHEAGCERRPSPSRRRFRPRRISLCCRPQGRDGDAKYVAQDVFGYSFLSDVFMADYKEKDVSWQGFLRPYRDVQEAKSVLEKYIAGVKKDGAEVKTLTADGADEMVMSTNIGLDRRRFPEGQLRGRSQRRHERRPAEAFARALAKSLPATVPTIESSH